MAAPKNNRNAIGNKGGRPTKYQGKETLEKAEEYIKSCVDEFQQILESENSETGRVRYVQRLKVKLPKQEGLALHLNVSLNTLKEWGEKHIEFLAILDKVNKLQAERVIDEALAGNYNSTIAKLLLGKHGYHEKSEQDITSDNKPIAGVVIMPQKRTPEEDGVVE
ncbi:MAG: hypothetical protein HYT63_03080 [Candidatus Yanofskybacteria bacterium]|nr:hypothetical protein [Candidatus Yanofskybacteria bacterium]